MPLRKRRSFRSFVVHPLEGRVLLASHPITPLPAFNQPQGAPGTIESERFDTGGEGISYHDPAGAPTVQPANDAGGTSYLAATPGEWFNYTISAAASTTYSLGIRVASATSGGTIHIEVDGQNATGPITIQNTGGSQNWITLNAPSISITTGQHVLSLVVDSSAIPGQSVGNFNWMSVSDNPATSPRTQWWRDAQFGMFIHWGLYSQLAGHWNGQTTTGFGEWIMNDLHIPLDQYAQVANQFNPTQFSAAQWVQTAQSAGMKYIVMTSKHHDGFSMFDTSANNYNVIDATPWRQDPINQLSTAAHAAGLHFGAYYSILNWADHNASAAGINTYMQTMETQLKELVQNDHVDLLWFDGEWPDWWTDERGRELTEYIRNLNPSVIINNRVGKRLVTDGDYDTPEQTIPTSEPSGRLWESAMTLNDTWGYKDTDNNWKSAATIVNDLNQIKAGHGNMLLNVGPTGAGVIPAQAVQILAQVGVALGVNTNPGGGGGTTPTPNPTPIPTPTPTPIPTPIPTPPPTPSPTPVRSLVVSAGQKITYTDASGHGILVSMRGPGSAQFDFATTANADVSQITLTNTSAASALTIKGTTTIGGVTAGAPVGALLAPSADLTGNFNASGAVTRLQLRSATGSNTISAASIQSLQIRGDFSDTLQATTLGLLTVGGALSNASIRTTGSIGSVLVGSALASQLFAGVRSDLTTAPMTAADLATPTATMKSFAVKPHGTFSSTLIAAGMITKAFLGVVASDNGAAPSGLAATKVQAVSATVAGRKKSSRNLTATTVIAPNVTVNILS
jgi:hypothetical protein